MQCNAMMAAEGMRERVSESESSESGDQGIGESTTSKHSSSWTTENLEVFLFIWYLVGARYTTDSHGLEIFSDKRGNALMEYGMDCGRQLGTNVTRGAQVAETGGLIRGSRCQRGKFTACCSTRIGFMSSSRGQLPWNWALVFSIGLTN